jgi:hypothetical protein
MPKHGFSGSDGGDGGDEQSFVTYALTMVRVGYQ